MSADGSSPLQTMARFGSIAIALVCVQLDYFALELALPDIAADLHSTTTDLHWTVSAYMIAIGIGMVPGSRVADLVGHKRIVLIGLTIFGLASLWVGLSPNADSLIAARVAQGIGAGLYFPAAMALVSNATNEVERPRILGFLTGVAGIGTAVGPILGGGFVSTIGWRWVFLVNVPIALIAVVWGHFQLPVQANVSLGRKHARDLDWLGAVLIAVAVAGTSLGIDDASTDGLLTAITLVPTLLGLAAVAVFAMWERRANWPLIPPRLWANRDFTALVAAATIANMGVCVMLFISTLYLQQVRGYTGLIAGLMFIPAALGQAAGGPVSGRLVSRYPGQRVMTVALLAGAMSLLALAFTDEIVAFLVAMGISSFLLGLGFQFGNIAVQSVVKPTEAATAAGVLLTLMTALGGVAVVVASATIEAVGTGEPTERATTAVLLTWALAIGALGILIGVIGWPTAADRTVFAPVEDAKS